ncbi:Phage conserved hypothetical protein [Rhabdaerophilaceae bacterium]
MIPFLLDGPQLEPISLIEAKAWLRREDNDEDSLIQALVVSARLMIEAEIGQVLLAQNWRLIGDAWPSSEVIPVSIGRIIAVAGARVFPVDGPATPILPSDLPIERGEWRDVIRPRNRPAPGRARGGLEIDVRLGFGEMASAIPDPLRLATRQLVAHWFENRGDIGAQGHGLPASVLTLVRPYRSIRL